MSAKNFPNVKELKRTLRHLGVELRSSQIEVSKTDYLVALHERHGDMLTRETLTYALGEYAWNIGRKAMKDIAADTEGVFEARQMVLPIRLQNYPVPQALPIKLDGKERTVTAVFANIEQGDAYTASLQGNAQACVNKVINWLAVWTPAREVMVDHPGMDFGDALQFLAEQEGPDAVPLPPIEQD